MNNFSKRFETTLQPQLNQDLISIDSLLKQIVFTAHFSDLYMEYLKTKEFKAKKTNILKQTIHLCQLINLLMLINANQNKINSFANDLYDTVLGGFMELLEGPDGIEIIKKDLDDLFQSLKNRSETLLVYFGKNNRYLSENQTGLEINL